MAKLTKLIWFNKALEFFGEHGLSNFKIENFCEFINVTKGSFYHHFESMNIFMDDLVIHWGDVFITPLKEELSKDNNLFNKIKALNDYSASINPKTELAIRAFAVGNKQAQSIVEDVDNIRVNFLKSLYTIKGIDSKEAENLANLEYAAFLGYMCYTSFTNEKKKKLVITEYRKHFRH